MTANQAVAVQPPYTCDSSGVVCQVPAELFSTTVQNTQTDSRGFTVTNNGTITVALPATNVPSGNNGTQALTWNLLGSTGTNSSDKKDAPTAGGSSGSLTFTNAGGITQTGNGGSLTFGIDAILAATQGGNGGNYTGTDNNQGGASPGSAGSVTFTNNNIVIFNGSFSVPTTSVVLARSIGGTGGSTTSRGPDSNGNPQYGSQNGTNGGSNPNYDHAGGQTVFTSNSTASAQSIGGLYQSAGSINHAALRSASVPKRLPGVMIDLYSVDNKLIATATTDQNGRYRFNTDYSGIGYVHVKPLKTFVVSDKGSQFPGGVTSAFDPASGKTEPVQLINGVVVNTNLNLVLSKIDSGLIVKGNSIRLNRKGTHSALWQTQLMPKSYHGGFTLSTFDVNNDTTPDYVLITKTGKPMAFIVDARTGQSTKLGGQVASNLRNGFVVQTSNLQGDSTKELILAPSRERSGRISVIDLQAKKVLWNATDFVLGGMKINQIGADPSGKSEYSNFQLFSLRQNDTFKILDGATGKLLETVSDRTRLAEKRQAMKAEKMQSASIASVPNATQPTGLVRVSIPRRRLPVMN